MRVKNGYEKPDGTSTGFNKKQKPVEQQNNQFEFEISTNTDQIVTAIKNLTESVITLTTVINKISTEQITEKKLFFRK
jgi:flagellar hook-basal body complex protein FliE